MRITEDDNFGIKDAFILIVIVVGAMLFAAAVHSKNFNDNPILEATEQTSQTTNDAGR